MKMRALLLSLLCLLSPFALADQAHHGFTLDDHLLDTGQKAAFAGAPFVSVAEQLDIVEASGLPPEILAFFKKTRIIVDPSVRGNPGIFDVRNGEPAVRIQPIVFPANKPIVLHELMHAYHLAVLTLKNPDILRAFDAASRPGKYPQAYQRAHFLQNEKEFFAVTSTIYLFGKIQQPPFDCAILSKDDPAYLDFLEKTFGRHECH